MDNKIIAVDFDGCLVENNYPGMGKPIWSTILDLRREQQHGARVILWTCRRGTFLDDAVEWCRLNDIYLDAVNENLPEMVEFFRGDTRKVFANEYWDDRAVLKPDRAPIIDCMPKLRREVIKSWHVDKEDADES